MPPENSQRKDAKDRKARKENKESRTMKKNLRRVALLVLVSGISLAAFSQTRERWQKSEKAKQSTVEKVSYRTVNVNNEDGDKENHDGASWFSRGYSLHQSGHYIEAIDAYSHAIGLGHRQATCMYNVAC